MPLKQTLTKLDEVPEALRSYYRQDGDKFVLDLDGGAGGSGGDGESEKLREFRNNNIRLSNEVDALKNSLKGFEGVDADMIKSLKEAREKSQFEEEKELLRKGKIDEVLTRRTQAVVAETEKKILATNKTLEEERNKTKALQSRLAALTVDREVIAAAEKAGLKIRQGASSDVMRRARDIWQIGDDGTMKPVGPDGQPLYSAKTAGQPMTMDEYITSKLAVEGSHLFEAAGGGGAGGGRPAVGGGNVLSSSDPVELGRNMKDIASGKTRVVLRDQG